MLIYNGIDLVAHFTDAQGNKNFIVNDIYGRGPMAQEIHSTAIPGRPGSYYQSRRIPDRFLGVKITMHGSSLADMRSKVDDLNSILNVSEPSSIAFADESDKVYSGMLHGEPNWNEIIYSGQGTINFICPDPYKYDAVEQTAILPTTVLNDGTAETKPKFKITVNQPITHFEITNHSSLTPQGAPKSIVLGRPADMTQTEIEREQLVFDDTMQSTDTWQLADRVDNGYVAGEMGANADGFYAKLFGEVVQLGDKKSQGPSLKKAIGQSLQDFRVDVFFKLFNVDHETGMIEVYLLDVNNNVVGKIGFEDIWKTRTLTQGKMQAGDQNTGYDIYTQSDYPSGWNNFDGIMRIERVGNVWTPYFAVINANGQHDWIRGTLRFTDNANAYTNPITQVQVAIRKWPLTDACDMSVHRIKAFKINEPQTVDEVPYIALPGDVIEIDTASDQPVRLNGEPVGDIIGLTTDLFDLLPGYNVLTVSPGADVEVTYPRRWL